MVRSWFPTSAQPIIPRTVTKFFEAGLRPGLFYASNSNRDFRLALQTLDRPVLPRRYQSRCHCWTSTFANSTPSSIDWSPKLDAIYVYFESDDWPTPATMR